MKITEDDFFENYKPVKNHLDDNAGWDGCMFETYGDELMHVRKELISDQTKIWTLVTTCNGDFAIIAGYHFVNRFGYFITEKSWTSIEDQVEIEQITEVEFEEPIYGIIERKKQGIDCTESESADIKNWLRELKLPFEQPAMSEIQGLFPIEYGEFLDEIQTH
jgi:hypothetical protein